MSHDAPSPNQIAHVLFLDIVGWSRESINAQGRLLAELSRLVTESPTFQTAKAAGQLMAFPSGDGMWILFHGDLTGPARCAAEVAHRLRTVEGLAVRMGIHSGPVRFQTDIAGTQTVVGDGINTAKRVMDIGSGGQILLSAQYASWLKQFEEWAPHVSPAGQGETKHGERLNLFALVVDGVGADDARTAPPTPPAPGAGMRVVVVYKRHAQPDDRVLAMLESRLGEAGNEVFIDRHLKIGIEWARAIEEKIRAADAVVAVISDAAVGSEMLEYELETAYDENRKRGKPFLLPIRVGSDRKVEGTIGSYINGLNFSFWHGPEDDARVADEVLSALAEAPKPTGSDLPLEPVGGAVPPDSPFYETRSSDAEFTQALLASESIILVRGPRQIGKTSLIGQGAKLARANRWRSVSTDFQKLSSSHMATDEGFYRLLAATLARQLKFKYDFAEEWMDVFGANMNLDHFTRTLIEASDEPLVWFMDEADKLFGLPFASDFFGLVRAWHNSRATDPGGPWERFTVVIGYATEAHLFIQDLNQSPFNVGRQITLQPFTPEQLWDLNERYGTPIRSRTDADALHHLVGGQPFLTRRALDVLARGQMDYRTLVETAGRDDGAFGDHLKRILISVTQLPTVHQALRHSLTQPEMTSQTDGFQRLLAAGVLKQTVDNRIVLTCELYRRYLASHV
ncbi:MAG: AAA-like domain-containing protein [Fimbriimonas sp.]